jgi:tRNA (guanine37-N1)-methyltransferase
MPRIKNVLDVPGDPEYRLVLLQDGLTPAKFAECHVAMTPAPATTTRHEQHTLRDLVSSENLQVTDGSVELGYEHMTASEILKRLLPSTIETPSSFETVGHIVHLNLRDEALPYRRIIGQVLLDKITRVRTVVNKVGTIENEWRVFEMEVLAGEDDTIAEVRQGGLRYKLDFRKVYWNSRLEAEHERLVHTWFSSGQVVADAMAGVGPFAVPAAKKGCTVLANDLNPDSHHWLLENIALNKVGASVSATCLDGREFLRQVAGGQLRAEPGSSPAPLKPRRRKKGQSQPQANEHDVQEHPPQQQQQEGEEGLDAGDDGGAARRFHSNTIQNGNRGTDASQPLRNPATAPDQTHPAHILLQAGIAPPPDHVVMNLPATAVEFLDALHGSFSRELWQHRTLPMVHVYAFLRSEESIEDLRKRIEKALGGALDNDPEFHSVRDVAPNKRMYCASFRVPAAVAFAIKDDCGDNHHEGREIEEAANTKRQKTDFE